MADIGRGDAWDRYKELALVRAWVTDPSHPDVGRQLYDEYAQVVELALIRLARASGAQVFDHGLRLLTDDAFEQALTNGEVPEALGPRPFLSTWLRVALRLARGATSLRLNAVDRLRLRAMAPHVRPYVAEHFFPSDVTAVESLLLGEPGAEPTFTGMQVAGFAADLSVADAVIIKGKDDKSMDGRLWNRIGKVMSVSSEIELLATGRGPEGDHALLSAWLDDLVVSLDREGLHGGRRVHTAIREASVPAMVGFRVVGPFSWSLDGVLRRAQQIVDDLVARFAQVGGP